MSSIRDISPNSLVMDTFDLRSTEFDVHLTRDKSQCWVKLRGISGSWEPLEWIVEYLDRSYVPAHRFDSPNLSYMASLCRQHWREISEMLGMQFLPTPYSSFVRRKRQDTTAYFRSLEAEYRARTQKENLSLTAGNNHMTTNSYVNSQIDCYLTRPIKKMPPAARLSARRRVRRSV